MKNKRNLYNVIKESITIDLKGANFERFLRFFPVLKLCLSTTFEDSSNLEPWLEMKFINLIISYHII